MSSPILAAGDHFVLCSLLADALRAELGGATEIRELVLPWPIEPFGPVAEVEEASGTEEELIEALAGVSICVTQMAPLTERVLAACPDLELFAVCRGGPVNANLAAATRHGVAVCYAPGRNAPAAAEYAVGLMLAAMRRIPETHASLREGRWEGAHYTYERSGFELEGTTVGLIGYGAIGSRVARILRGFGARVLVHDPYVDPDVLEGIAEPVDLPDLLVRARIVTLHARVTPETEGMIGADQLATMPPGAVLVNTARGALVDYPAVCEALRSGHLGAAAFDVFPEEPLSPDSCLHQAPNVVMTPHLAGASRPTAQRAARIVVAEVGHYVRGEELSHCANPAVLGGRRSRRGRRG